MMDYAVVILKLSDEDGGGYLARVPDLYGCMSDGETPEEAIRNVQDAIGDWIEVSKALGRAIPEPGSSLEAVREREAALIGTIKILFEQLDGIDGRLDEIVQEIDHLKDVIENQEAWSHFDGIIKPDGTVRATARALC